LIHIFSKSYILKDKNIYNFFSANLSMINGRNKLEKDYFLICPVRGATEKEKLFIENLIDDYETKGKGIHYPLWDTNQDDSIGYNICTENKNGIKNAKKGILVYLNENSAGSMFDLGMTFMSGKSLKLVNDFSEFEKLGKNLGHVVRDYIFNPKIKSSEYKEMMQVKEMIQMSDDLGYTYDENKFYTNGKFNPNFLFDFGMAFMSGKPISISNPQELKPTEHKSFENVLLYLDKLSKANKK